MGFFDDLFGGTPASVQNVRTGTPQQQGLQDMLAKLGGSNLEGFKPFPGPTQRLSPTANEQGIFNKLPGLTSKIGNRQPSQAGQQGQQQIAQARTQRQEQKPDESEAEIINKGMSSTLAKILAISGLYKTSFIRA